VKRDKRVISKSVDNSQNTRMEPKKISLFDDDDDDGDLFGAKPTKSKNEHKTDLFENEDDLFLAAKREKMQQLNQRSPRTFLVSKLKRRTEMILQII